MDRRRLVDWPFRNRPGLNGGFWVLMMAIAAVVLGGVIGAWFL